MYNRLNGLLFTVLFLLMVAACSPAAGEPVDAGRVIAAGPSAPALAAVEATTIPLVSAQITTPVAASTAVATATALATVTATASPPASPTSDNVQATIDAGVAATVDAQATIDTLVAATVAAQEAAQATEAISIPPTAMPSPTATTAPAATTIPSPTPCQLTVTATLNAFLREGPSVQYQEVGVLGAGESATVIGRDANFGWWVIPFDGRHGWVSGAVVALNDCANYPGEVPAPPLPTAAPTATVAPSPTPPPAAAVVVIDLLALAPEGHWETAQLLADGHNGRNVTVIPFQGSGSTGAVRLVTRELEDGVTRYILDTHPKWVDNGTIKGWLPWVALPQNAVFEAEVGFISGAGASDGVTFWVFEHHIENSREVWNPIIRVTKQYDGRLIPLRADLSHLAGRNVSIELRVDAGASSGQDWAVWVAPRITGN